MVTTRPDVYCRPGLGLGGEYIKQLPQENAPYPASNMPPPNQNIEVINVEDDSLPNFYP